MKKTMFRLCCIMTVLVLFLCSFAFIASAEEIEKEVRVINYRDYLDYRDISAGNYVNYLSFPTVMNSWTAYNINDSSNYFESKAQDLFVFKPSDVAPADVLYAVLFKPVDNSYITLNNIPSGSVFSFDYKLFVTSNVDYYAVTNGIARIYYFDANGVILDYQSVNFGSDHIGDPTAQIGTGSSHISYKGDVTVTKPSGARYMQLFFYLRPIIDSNVDYDKLKLSIRFETTSSLSVAIAKDYVDEETQRLSNEILGEITDQNDDLIHGTGSQIEQVGSDVSQLQQDGDRLSSLTDSMQTNKPNADTIDVSISSLIPDSDILIFTAPLLAIWENRTLLSYITIVLTLVLVSWVMFGKK